jgi:hypothetical protein
MSYTRMIKGARTELTYKVVVKRWLWWEAFVYEPYKRRRWWGLLPDALAYRHVYTDDNVSLKDYLKPDEIQSIAERTVRKYEDHKLAWEAAPELG